MPPAVIIAGLNNAGGVDQNAIDGTSFDPASATDRRRHSLNAVSVTATQLLAHAQLIDCAFDGYPFTREYYILCILQRPQSKP
jgi:hypothetical protein